MDSTLSLLSQLAKKKKLVTIPWIKLTTTFTFSKKKLISTLISLPNFNNLRPLKLTLTTLTTISRIVMKILLSSEKPSLSAFHVNSSS